MGPRHLLARWVLVEHFPNTHAIYEMSGHLTRGSAERAQRAAEIECDNAVPNPFTTFWVQRRAPR